MIKLLLFSSLTFFVSSAISQNSDFYFSNQGNDSSDGFSNATARRTLDGSATILRTKAVENGSVRLGLKIGDIFREAFKPTYPLQVGGYGSLNGGFAVFDGASSYDTGWHKTQSTVNTYEQAILYKTFTGYGVDNLGRYSYIYVYEIDKNLELLAPFSARRLLKLARSQNAVDSLSGSFYEIPSRADPMTVYIHTSDGQSPNHHPKYRYEVTVLDKAIDGRVSDDNHFENLWVRGYGAGVGPLPSGVNSQYTNIIFGPGAAIHHAVPKSGTFDRCLFLPGPENTNAGGAIVFYNDEGFFRTNKILQSIFLDIPYPVYAHTSRTPYQNITVKKSLFFGPGNKGRALSGANTISMTIDSVLVQGFARGYQSSAPILSIKNSYFLDFSEIAISILGINTVAEIENVFVKGNSPFGIIEGTGTDLKLRHSIFRLGGNFIRKDKNNKIQARGNIFILDSERNQAVFSITNTDAGAGTSSDIWNNNVYILLKGKPVWQISNSSSNNGKSTVGNLKDWQVQSGQDRNSLFIDLRKDPRGLQAIFIDPDNGNYTLANTNYGNKIKAISAGMITPPTCFSPKPTYEAAEEMIRTNSTSLQNRCRLPCQKNAIEVRANKSVDSNGIINVCRYEEIIFSAKGFYPDNGKSYTQSDATSRFLWWSSDEKDTSGLHLQQIIKTFESAGLHSVKLQMVDANGCSEEFEMKVKVNALPVQPVITASDSSFCNGKPIFLYLNSKVPGQVYSWNISSANEDTIKVLSSGPYSVKAINTFGCSASDTFTVRNRSFVQVSLGPDKIYCKSIPLKISASATGVIKSVAWNTGDTGLEVDVTHSGVYTISIVDTIGCIATDTVIIADNPLNRVLLPADTAVCEGQTLRFQLQTPAYTNIAWNDGSNSPTRSLTAGSYFLVLENKQCSLKGGFNVVGKSIPAFKSFRDTTICQGFEVLLTANFPGATTLWSTGETKNNISIKERGAYWAESKLNGCAFRDTVKVETLACDCNFSLPNAFSPNGDGINDLFRPQFSCFPQNYHLTIFNRYGQQVFNSTNFRDFWNGEGNNSPAPLGTYYYVVSFYDQKQALDVKHSGNITLLR